MFPVLALSVVLFGWDGADWRVVQEMLGRGELPNLSALESKGELRVEGTTQTKPSWTTQLTGLPWYVHGTQNNQVYKPVMVGKTLFEILSAAGLTSAYIAGKCAAGQGQMCVQAGYPMQNIKPPVTVQALADSNLTLDQLMDKCLAARASANFVFCHSQQPDHDGHAFGGFSEEYRQRLRDLDAKIPLFSGSTLIITSDHGFEQGGDPELDIRPYIFPRGQPLGYTHLHQVHALIASSACLNLAYASTLDVAPTILDYLGVARPAWMTDGRSLRE